MFLKLKENLFIYLNPNNGVFGTQNSLNSQESFIPIPASIVFTDTISADYVYAIFAKLINKTISKSAIFVGAMRRITMQHPKSSELVFFSALNKSITNKVNYQKGLRSWVEVSTGFYIFHRSNHEATKYSIIFTGSNASGKSKPNENPIDYWVQSFLSFKEDKATMNNQTSVSIEENYISLYPKDGEFSWGLKSATNEKKASLDEIRYAQQLKKDDIYPSNTSVYAFIGHQKNKSESCLTYLVSISQIGIRRVEKTKTSNDNNYNEQIYSHIKFLSCSFTGVVLDNTTIVLYNGPIGNNIFLLTEATSRKRKNDDSALNMWNLINNHHNCSWIISPANNKTKKNKITNVECSKDWCLTPFAIKNEVQRNSDLRLHSVLEESVAQVPKAFSLKIQPENIIKALKLLDGLSKGSKSIIRYARFKIFQSHAFRIMKPQTEKSNLETMNCDFDQVLKPFVIIIGF
jgi:hypothetical protein